MQFHLNGFEQGDPEISDPSQRHPGPGSQGTVASEVDVLIARAIREACETLSVKRRLQ